MSGSNKKRILIYLVFCFASAFLVDYFLLYPRVRENGEIHILLSWPVMFLPLLSALLTAVITKDKVGISVRSARINRKTVFCYLAAWFLPAVLVGLGAVLYFCFFPQHFDPEMTAYMKVLGSTRTDLTVAAVRSTVIGQIIASVILGPVIECVPSFFEISGWFGYFLPKLEAKGRFAVKVLLGGFLWGLWYAPYLATGLVYGNDYSGYPWAGILLRILFCISFGMAAAVMTQRTGNCIPAMIMRGAFASVAGYAQRFTVAGNTLLLGPSVNGIISMLPFIITSVILFALFCRKCACGNGSSCDTINEVSDKEISVG